MVKIVYTNRFLKSAKKLPLNIQDKLGSNLEILQENPFNSSLHTKPLTGKLVGLYSFRNTRDWRVLFSLLTPKLLS